MAFEHGKVTCFKIDNSGGALQDISAYLSSVDFQGYKVDTAETSTFSKTSKTYVAGLKDGTISVEGYRDDTVDGILAGIVGLTGSFEYGPEGGTGGDTKYYGECICTGYSNKSDIGDAAKFTATFQITGDVSIGAF